MLVSLYRKSAIMLDNSLIGAMPTCVEYERILLGSVLMDSDLFMKVADTLSPTDFALPEHRLVFNAMKATYSEFKFFTEGTILEYLTKNQILDKAGGAVFISKLQEFFAPKQNLADIMAMIKKTSLARQTIQESVELIQLCKNSGNDELLTKAQKLVHTLTSSRVNSLDNSFISLKDAIKMTFTSLMQQKAQNMTTTFPSLDRIISGFRNKELIVIGARPSMGKTAFIVTIIKNMIDNGKSVGFLTAEMSTNNIIIRLITQYTGLQFQDIAAMNMSSDSFNSLSNCISTVEAKPLFLDEDTIQIYDIKKRARYLKQTQNTQILFIDYLQRLSAGGKKDNMEIAYISSELKSLAKELDIPIVVLSQLNRNLESRPDKHPQLSDLRDSGSIEQDADAVLLLYRDEYYNAETQTPNQLEVNVAKNRNGALGKTSLYFDAPTMSFQEFNWV